MRVPGLKTSATEYYKTVLHAILNDYLQEKRRHDLPLPDRGQSGHFRIHWYSKVSTDLVTTQLWVHWYSKVSTDLVTTQLWIHWYSKVRTDSDSFIPTIITV